MVHYALITDAVLEMSMFILLAKTFTDQPLLHVRLGGLIVPPLSYVLEDARPIAELAPDAVFSRFCFYFSEHFL